ncbi:putative arabinase [Testicularia cyperi]|uniref:Putative arabinase n=1 Tax=Testicularia cyperi TaxID=1882483 RepID=A0A317XYS1_9BASI|nr:putative arabinase [Testicularia cyperi]
MLSLLKSTFLTSSVAILALTSTTFSSPVPAEDLAERQSNSYVGYGFFYFIGNGAGQEQIYAAVSKGNSPTSWDLLNSGKPILTSTVGTKGVRDPSIVRSQDGSKFWLLATDLNIGSGTSFGQASTNGSRSIVIWETSDLKNWSGPRLSQVINSTAGDAWAPEALYNTNKGQLFAASDTAHSGSSYHRIMRSSTTDFKTFTNGQVYVDRHGDSVLDLTFLKANDGSLYRFIKNENPTSDPYPLTVYQEKSSNGTPDGTWTKVTENIGAGSIGSNEGPTAFLDNQNPNTAWLWVDEYNNRGYVALKSSNPAQGGWTYQSNASEPSNHARHGTILPLTQTQYNNMRSQV